MIKLLVPDVPPHRDILPHLEAMDAARWYTNFGPLACRFESELATVLGVAPASVCSVSNCTAGLELALAALDLPPGSRVLLPSLTFVATAAAVVRAGLVPLLADVDPGSWTLTPLLAERALSSQRFDCVLPVAAFGCPAPAAEWDQFSRASGVPVVIDAAGAFGNQPIGERTCTVFSFHATKTLGIGEGGAVVSNNPALVAGVRRLSNFGIDTSSGQALAAGGNAKLSEYHAAVGLAALARWRGNAGRRRELHTAYRARLSAACPGLGFQQRPDDGVYSILQVRLPAGARNAQVAAGLARRGIETRLWYLPLLGAHPAYRHCPVAGDQAVANELAGRLLGLPFHLDLDAAAVREVAHALAAVLADAP